MRKFMAILSALISLSVAAEPAAPVIKNYSEGKDYTVLAEPLRTADSSKIEVGEAFAYPCHACFNFEPTFATWIKTQEPDVVIAKTHVSFRPEWTPYQRGYYTVLSLKLKQNLTMDIFNAIHRDHHELNDAQAWAELLADYGVDKQTVINTYDSFAVSSQMKQADARTAGYRVDSTPTIIVEGKYKVSNKLGSYDEMLNVTQFLVNKARAERIHH